MPQVRAKRNYKPSSRQVVLVFFISIILVLVVGFGYVLGNMRARQSDDEFQTQTDLDNQLTAQSKYAMAAKQWGDYANRSPGGGHQATAYVNAAIDFINARQYDDAISSCKKAETLQGVTFEEATVAAQAYSGAGDKPTAISYYRKAIQLVPAGQTGRDFQIGIINQDIVALGGQP